MESKTSLFRSDSILIPIKIVSIYIAWKIFHHFASVESTGLNIFWKQLCEVFGTAYAVITAKMLVLFGQKAYSSGINIYLAQQKEIWVQEHCLAIPAKVIFVGSILSFHGKWKDKFLFIVIGLMGIILINIARLIFVSLAWLYFPLYFFDMNHSLIYAVLAYGFIFFMIRWWIKRQIGN
ncbi:MAG: archaeosortase/exosortase family protein [Chitinophagales bacterium]|nr:archaeosortase/exosortase family protein [Chitinophagales bacterium]